MGDALDMQQRFGSFRVLSLAGLAGVVVGAFALAADISIDLRRAVGHDHVAVVRWCSGLSDTPEAKFYSEIEQVNVQMHKDMEILPTGDVDRDFAQMMIPHHQGAIDMALVLLKHGRDERLKRLAQSIIIEQGQEIAYMRSLLAAPIGEKSKSNPIADQ
jgi:uncharacterized protein (DUF305 family)